jgi:hypothetical protein
MLKEFAFTPQVFDPSAAPNEPQWREYLRALAMTLFRAPSAPPIVVSGLYWNGGESAWEGATKAIIEAIPDGELRRDAQALFTQVTKHLVARPPGPDWPGDEEPGWGMEAAISHRREPLDRVVAQRIESVPEDAPRTALSSVVASDFWNLLHTTGQPPASLVEAVSPLRLVLRHSDLLVLSMPYEPCEVFTLECIRRACQRPTGTMPPIIHVHRKAPAKPAAKAAWVGTQLAGKLFGAEVHYYFWPEPYRERLVLGCRLADLGGGKLRPAVRWGVSMTHLWGEGNPATEAPSTYSLLPAGAATDHLKRLQDQATVLGISPLQMCSGPSC